MIYFEGYYNEECIKTNYENYSNIFFTIIIDKKENEYILNNCIIYNNNLRLINESKKYLNDTDYIVIKIMENVASNEEYSTELINRKKTRNLINDLENENLLLKKSIDDFLMNNYGLS